MYNVSYKRNYAAEKDIFIYSNFVHKLLNSLQTVTLTLHNSTLTLSWFWLLRLLHLITTCTRYTFKPSDLYLMHIRGQDIKFPFPGKSGQCWPHISEKKKDNKIDKLWHKSGMSTSIPHLLILRKCCMHGEMDLA